MRRTLYGPDHDAFRESVRAFVARTIEPSHDSAREHRGIARDVWLEAGRQGLLGFDVPEEYGGSGGVDYRFSAVFTEELARVAMAYASCMGIHYDIVAPYLVELGTAAQKQRWLPRFCSGELVTAIAMTEPSAGSDLAALRTTATRTADGGWILNGAKTFITNGFAADLVVVAARTTPGTRSKGITLFAVESGTPGFERGRKLDKVGQPEADTAELFFNDVHLPEDSVLGECDRGFAHMMQRLPRERLNAAIANVAHAAQILAETVLYAKERSAFGQPIGAFQHNKFLLAELVTQLDVTQAYIDDCIAAHADGELTAIDAAKAKLWSARVQNEVLDGCVQLYGGYGYMREYRVARAWMDARVTRIWAGSNEIMKEIIGRDLGL
ncbi:MAG TPA: acyl-CoA dehydrogenase family protein [Candidatus Angelobacter sp.]|jgi:alkylation response protein AidB-like acyl-CoA dehydrogenase|nr:acyl-CoA dehydrogenase family protein [Candidatus Angelobacter sp.]